MQLFYRKKLLKNSYRLNSFTLEPGDVAICKQQEC